MHFAIVGAGPAGAALGYLLARAGGRVTLLERQTDFAREFRGEVLMPSGLDAIAQMGLGAALDALPQSSVSAGRALPGRAAAVRAAARDRRSARGVAARAARDARARGGEVARLLARARLHRARPARPRRCRRGRARRLAERAARGRGRLGDRRRRARLGHAQAFGARLRSRRLRPSTWSGVGSRFRPISRSRSASICRRDTSRSRCPLPTGGSRSAG